MTLRRRPWVAAAAFGLAGLAALTAPPALEVLPATLKASKTGTLRLRSKSRSAIQLPEYTALSLLFHVTVTCLKQCPAI